MKKTDLILILLFYGSTLTFVGTSTAAAEHMVKVIYFVPSDRVFQWNIPIVLDTQIKVVQRFYAEQMEAHGHGRKTFNLETDTNGKLVVHPVTGKFGDAHYHIDTLNKITEEVGIQFDIGKDIYIVIVDVSRQLDLGHRNAGSYVSRSNAAYWDGKNAFGEPVVSGLYFYTLTAGEFRATRRMLIRK